MIARATLLAQARALAARADHGSFLVLTAAAPESTAERAAASAIAGELSFLVSDDVSHVARGSVARIRARGTGRFESVRDQARVLFERVIEGDDPAVPSPVLLGGFSFRSGESDDPAWLQFGEADFVLPRWRYVRTDAGAFVQWIVPVEALGREDLLGDEFDRADRALAECTQQSVSVSHRAQLEELATPAWRTLVERALDTIRDGTFEKVVLARRSVLSAEMRFDPIVALRRFAETQTGCTRFAFERGERCFLGATPETLLRFENRVVRTEALAGSIQRGSDADCAQLAASLLGSDKDRREHDAVVRAIVAALGASCGAISVNRVPVVRTLRSILHLHTPIEARAHEGTHLLDLAAALHPTPAVCGLPRESAESFIAREEPAPRGWYAGPVGYFDRRGHGHLVVALRSALIEGQKAWLYAGAGIVEGSDADGEYAETGVKQGAALAALGA